MPTQCAHLRNITNHATLPQYSVLFTAEDGGLQSIRNPTYPTTDVKVV